MGRVPAGIVGASFNRSIQPLPAIVYVPRTSQLLQSLQSCALAAGEAARIAAVAL